MDEGVRQFFALNHPERGFKGLWARATLLQKLSHTSTILPTKVVHTTDDRVGIAYTLDTSWVNSKRASSTSVRSETKFALPIS